MLHFVYNLNVTPLNKNFFCFSIRWGKNPLVGKVSSTAGIDGTVDCRTHVFKTTGPLPTKSFERWKKLSADRKEYTSHWLLNRLERITWRHYIKILRNLNLNFFFFLKMFTHTIFIYKHVNLLELLYFIRMANI